MTGALLVAALLALTVRTEGAAPEVWVQPIEGLTVDSLARGEFVDAFRATLASAELGVERSDGETWATTAPLLNRFLMVPEAADDRDAWTVRVVLALPPIASFQRRESNGSRQSQIVRTADPKRRNARRFGVSVAAWSPQDRIGQYEAQWVQESLAFPAQEAPAGSWFAPSGRGYAFPWADAGRAAALVTLEVLHRRSGDLEDDVRIELAPAVRMRPHP